MVAVDLLPGIDISITVAGQALTEHEDHDEEQQDRTTARYVEAISGQIFEVRITAQKGFRSGGDALSFRIHVDGSKAINIPVLQNSACRFENYVHVSQGSQQNASEVRRYCFATLETSSDGRAFAGDAAKLKDLGSIEVTVHQVQVTGVCELSTVAKDLSSVGVVSEKAFKGKAISHSVNFTAPTSCKPKQCVTAVAVPGLPDPYAKIIFRYRSLESLKSMLIIPRIPTPPPLEERRFETVNREEFLEIQRQLKEMKEKHRLPNVKVKRERTDDNPRRRKVARPSRHSTQLELDEEGGVRESATPTLAEREIIELD